MNLLLVVLSALFRFQDALAHAFRVGDRTPTAPPAVSAEEAAGGTPFGWLKTSDGLRLFYRYWLPTGGRAVASLVCIHGVGAHGRHFCILGERLTRSSVAVYALDLRGHGLSEGRRGDLTDLGRIVADIGDMVGYVAKAQPGAPVFLMGESFGALLTVKYAACRPANLAGIILSAPELEPTEESTGGLRQALRQYLRFVPYVIFCSRARVIDIAGREELVSRNPEIARQSSHDPLRNNKLSPRTVVQIYHLIAGAMDIARQIVVPVLILQGGSDLVTNPQAAWKLREHLGSEDKRLAFFPDAYHGLFYDPDTPKVLDTMDSWLSDHSCSSLETP